MIEKIEDNPFEDFNNKMADKIELPPAAEIPQEVLNQQTIQQMAPDLQFGMNQPVPPIEYPTQQAQQPNTGYTQQPNNAYMPQSNTGFMPQPNAGYIPQNNMAYTPQPNMGYTQQPNNGYMPPSNAQFVPETFNIPTATQPMAEQPTTQSTEPTMVQPTLTQPVTEQPVAQPTMEQPITEQPIAEQPIAQSTATQITQQVPQPVTQPTIEPIIAKFNKLSIEPTGVPQKNISECTLEELLKGVSDVVSENCYAYINEMLGNNFVVNKLNDNPSKAECFALISKMPLNASFEKWLEVEAELEKNKDLYNEASTWVTNKIKENNSTPKYAMGRSDVVFTLYKEFYSLPDTPTDATNDTAKDVSKNTAKGTTKKTRTSKKKTANEPTVTEVVTQPTMTQPTTQSVQQPTQPTEDVAPGQVNMLDNYSDLW